MLGAVQLRVQLVKLTAVPIVFLMVSLQIPQTFIASQSFLTISIFLSFHIIIFPCTRSIIWLCQAPRLSNRFRDGGHTKFTAPFESLVIIAGSCGEHKNKTNLPLSIAKFSQLHQTGKILRDPNQRNPRQSGLTQRRINEYVPFANRQFHDALDEIEVEIVCESSAFDLVGVQIQGGYRYLQSCHRC